MSRDKRKCRMKEEVRMQVTFSGGGAAVPGHNDILADN